MLVQQQVAETLASGFPVTTEDFTGLSTTFNPSVPVGATTYEVFAIGRGLSNFGPGQGGGGGAFSGNPPVAIGAVTALHITFGAAGAQTVVRENTSGGTIVLSVNSATNTSGANTTTGSPVGTTKYAGGTANAGGGGGGAGGPLGAGSPGGSGVGGAGGGAPAGAGGNNNAAGNAWGGGGGGNGAAAGTSGVRIIWR